MSIQSEVFQKFVKKNARHNFLVNLLDISFFQFGINVVSLTIVLPAFALQLGASNLAIGFIPAIMQLGWFLPQLFSSFFVEGIYRKKTFLLIVSLFQRLPWLGIGVSTLLLADSHPTAALGMFFLLYCIAAGSGGVAGPAWGEIIAKAIPGHIRGQFFGYANLAGNALAVLSGLIVKFVMEGDRFSYPINYSLLFFCGGGILFISYFFFSLNREPLVPAVKQEKHLLNYFRNVPEILKNNSNFAWLIISRILGHSNLLSLGFLMPFAMKRFDLTDSITGNFVLVSTLATMVISPVLGKVADQLGHKFVLIFSRFSFIGCIIFAVFAQNSWMMMVSFGLLAISMSAFMISMMNIVIEFSPENKRPTYLGLAGTLPAPFMLLFAFMGGVLADLTSWGYLLPFWISLILNVISAFILIVFVRDPRTSKN